MPITIQEPCTTWVRQDIFPPPLGDISNTVSCTLLPDGSKPDVKIVIARAILVSAKILDKFYIPINQGQFAMNEQVMDFSAGIYEMLCLLHSSPKVMAVFSLE